MFLQVSFQYFLVQFDLLKKKKVIEEIKMYTADLQNT